MLRKSPVFGIYIACAAALVLSSILIGVSVISLFIFVEIFAAAILVAGRQHLLLAVSLALGILAAAGIGGPVAVGVMLAFLLTGVACGLFIRPGADMTKSFAAGSVVFTLTAVGALLAFCYSTSGKLSSEVIFNTLSSLSDKYTMLMVKLAQAAGNYDQSVNTIKAISAAFKSILTLEYVGVAGSIGVMVSFVTSLLALLCVSKEAGVPSNLLNFKLSRVGGIAMILLVIAVSVLSGKAQIVTANLAAVLSSASFMVGILFFIALIRSGQLFRIPFLFLGMLIGFLFLGIPQTLACVGVYRSLDINWSKLKPPGFDGDDF